MRLSVRYRLMKWGDKISVILPINEFLIFKTLNRSIRLQPVLCSMTLVPALIYVLDLLKTLAQTESDEYEAQYSWYRSIKKTLADKTDESEGGG